MTPIMEDNTSIQLQSTSERPTCIVETEFDPCTNAKPCSPFYLYNHDSPRPSMDMKQKYSPNVSVRDLESGAPTLTPTLTPTVTQEKRGSNKQSLGRLQQWRSTVSTRKCQQLTQPKKQSWLKRLPKKQQIIVKICIALFIVGCMVGIAVGIAVSLRSNVWKGNNQQDSIHT